MADPVRVSQHARRIFLIAIEYEMLCYFCSTMQLANILLLSVIDLTCNSRSILDNIYMKSECWNVDIDG